MPLSDTAIRALKPRDKSYKVTDEKGLYLLVTPAGGRIAIATSQDLPTICGASSIHAGSPHSRYITRDIGTNRLNQIRQAR